MYCCTNGSRGSRDITNLAMEKQNTRGIITSCSVACEHTYTLLYILCKYFPHTPLSVVYLYFITMAIWGPYCCFLSLLHTEIVHELKWDNWNVRCNAHNAGISNEHIIYSHAGMQLLNYYAYMQLEPAKHKWSCVVISRIFCINRIYSSFIQTLPQYVGR